MNHEMSIKFCTVLRFSVLNYPSPDIVSLKLQEFMSGTGHGKDKWQMRGLLFFGNFMRGGMFGSLSKIMKYHLIIPWSKVMFVKSCMMGWKMWSLFWHASLKCLFFFIKMPLTGSKLFFNLIRFDHHWIKRIIFAGIDRFCYADFIPHIKFIIFLEIYLTRLMGRDW